VIALRDEYEGAWRSLLDEGLAEPTIFRVVSPKLTRLALPPMCNGHTRLGDTPLLYCGLLRSLALTMVSARRGGRGVWAGSHVRTAGQRPDRGQRGVPAMEPAAHLHHDHVRYWVSGPEPKTDGVEILLNNAGTMPKAQQIYKVPEEVWQYTMGVKLHAPWYLANLTREHMKTRGGGVIVNVSSNSGLHHDVGLGLYGISKAALMWLSTVRAKEWARDGIRVNCLAPGVVRTELAHDVITYLEEHDTKPNPLNLIAEPADIAGLVRFIVSPRARYLTGRPSGSTAGNCCDRCRRAG
jgi:Enoyl-(Acyl carrier protein) reductase